MSWSVYLAVFVVMVVASTVQSSVGFGQGLIAAPLLRLLHPDLLPGPLVLCGLLVSLGVVVRNGKVGDVRELLPALGGRLIGIAAALILLAQLSARGLTLVIAGLVLTFVAARLLGVAIPRSPQTLGAAGVFSGVGGTIAGLGGAPIALVLEQHANAREFRGPLGIYQLAGAVMTLVALIAAGELDGEGMQLGLALYPPLIIGWFAAKWITPIVDRGLLRPIVLGLSSGSALVLIAGELLG